MATRALQLADIVDVRAYERERDKLRGEVIALKAIRRVTVGPVVSMVFENRDTIRFQVQEMARAERASTDEAVLDLLGTYNPLIPEAGHLSATLFIELTNRAEMQHWLSLLVGIEESLQLQITLPGADLAVTTIKGHTEEGHAAQLTRSEVTAAVHFIHFDFTADQVELFRRGRVAVAVDHPSYLEHTELSEATRASLLGDLLG
ncbi:MAG: DUF3501 family protein [Gallionella sp.]|jgi:hypothetical protein|nr:DUF3501 family protein [Gallionella sp.]